MVEIQTDTTLLQNVLMHERPRLLAFCVSKTGNTSIAEDLVQETLLEAWRHYDALREPERISQWLMGIARNVCLRWLRANAANHQVSSTYQVTTGAGPSANHDDNAIELADAEDFIAELEQHELVELLSRALALLSPDVRHLLIAHYIEERPLAQIGEQLGLPASAIAMRLQRGRLAMRRVLAAEFSHEVAAYTLASADQPWEETRLWCMSCGLRRLRGRYDPQEGELWLRCPTCSIGSAEAEIHTHSLTILGGVKGYQRAYKRLLTWVESAYRQSLSSHSIACARCGRNTPLSVISPVLEIPAEVNSVLGKDALGFYHICSFCGQGSWCFESLSIYLLAQPAAQHFYQAHSRLRALPVYEVESDGHAAFVSRFESVNDHERLVMVSAADTLELLHTYCERGV